MARPRSATRASLGSHASVRDVVLIRAFVDALVDLIDALSDVVMVAPPLARESWAFSVGGRQGVGWGASIGRSRAGARLEARRSLCYITLHHIALYCSVLHCITFNHIASHCTTLHHITLHHSWAGAHLEARGDAASALARAGTTPLHYDHSHNLYRVAAGARRLARPTRRLLVEV